MHEKSMDIQSNHVQKFESEENPSKLALIYRLWKLKSLIETAKIHAKSTPVPTTTAAQTPMKSCLIPK